MGEQSSVDHLTKTDNFSWEADVSLITNPLIVKQLAIIAAGSGLFMALLLTFIFAATGDFHAIPAMLLISLLTSTGLGFALFLIVLIFFGRGIRIRFTVNSAGVLWEEIDKRVKVTKRLALVAGVLVGSPQLTGAGVLAVSRGKEFVPWPQISSMESRQRHLMIILRNSWRPVMLLICTPENFHQIVGYINGKLQKALPSPKVKRAPLVKGAWRSILVIMAVAPFFMLADYPFELNILLPLLLFLFSLTTVWLIPLFGWVVLICAAVLAVQITLLGFSEYRYLYGFEQTVFFLAYAGLAYLIWFSSSSLRGKITPVLMDD